MLPPLFLHFALVFPERPHCHGYTALLARWLPAIYLPAAVLGVDAHRSRWCAPTSTPSTSCALIGLLERLESLYLAAFLAAGAGRAGSRAGRVPARSPSKRQLRWIVWGTALGAVPFALGYAMPFAFGVEPSLPMELSAIPLGFIPLAFASAIVRYRLMDVEVILKRLLVYTVGGGGHRRDLRAHPADVGRLLRPERGRASLDDRVPRDGHRGAAGQAGEGRGAGAIDRAFYRDRYDYRRALVAFARDLNGDLDLNRLADRLVSRVKETLERRSHGVHARPTERGEFEPLQHDGFDSRAAAAASESGIGGRLATARTPSASTIRWRSADSRAEEVEFWRDAGIYYFVPCVSKDTVDRRAGARPPRERRAAHQRRHWRSSPRWPAQAATAIENGRLYRQLHLKASELDRLRAFNENILESLDDGLLVVGLDDRVVRWNAGARTAVRRRARDGARPAVERLFDAHVVDAPPAARRDKPDGTTIFRMPLVGRGGRGRRSAAGQRHDRAAAGGGRRGRPSRHHRHPRGHHRARAARRAAAHLGKDGVARPAGRRRGARGQHAADRHLELHADAARAGRSRAIRARRCSRRSKSRRSAPRASSTAC